MRKSIPFALRLAQDASFSAFAKATGDADLRPGWYSILHLIDRNPGVGATVLGRTIGRDKSTLTPVLTELERRGLIVRRGAAHDGRLQRVYLTPPGRARLRTLARHAARHDRALDLAVGPRGKAPFLEALRRIVAAFDDDGRSAATSRPHPR